MHRHEIEGIDAAEKMKLDMEKTGHDIGVQIQWDGYNREKTIADAKAAAEARAETFAQEIKETEQALKWREQKNMIKQDDLQAIPRLQGFLLTKIIGKKKSVFLSPLNLN